MYISKCIICTTLGETSTTHVSVKSFFIPLSLFETALVKNNEIDLRSAIVWFYFISPQTSGWKKAIQYYASDLVPHDQEEIILLDKDYDDTQ